MIDIKNLPARIEKEEIEYWVGKSADGEPEIREQINTQLTMADYDWMQYEILAEIPLQGRKVMSIKFIYDGFTQSEMVVKIGDEEIRYGFPSSIFDEYLQKYLEAEIKAIYSFAFSGGDIILSFYEAVMASDKKKEVQDPE